MSDKQKTQKFESKVVPYINGTGGGNPGNLQLNTETGFRIESNYGTQVNPQTKQNTNLSSGFKTNVNEVGIRFGAQF